MSVNKQAGLRRERAKQVHGISVGKQAAGPRRLRVIGRSTVSTGEQEVSGGNKQSQEPRHQQLISISTALAGKLGGPRRRQASRKSVASAKSNNDRSVSKRVLASL